MTGAPCPECGEVLASRGLLLVAGEDDGQRVCRAVFSCPSGHRWWRRGDQDGALEVTPDWVKLP